MVDKSLTMTIKTSYSAFTFEVNKSNKFSTTKVLTAKISASSKDMRQPCQQKQEHLGRVDDR